jgi:Transposase DDE domain
MSAVFFKANAKCRHHIPKQKRRLTNWPAYEASLRRRGDLTVWFSAEAIATWRAEPRTNRGGQPWYSPLAILTALTLRTVFRLALRQTEGLIGSVMRLLGLDLPVPDTTLSRRSDGLAVPPLPRVPGRQQSSADANGSTLHAMLTRHKPPARATIGRFRAKSAQNGGPYRINRSAAGGTPY